MRKQIFVAFVALAALDCDSSSKSKGHSCDKFASAANRCADPEDRLTSADVAACKESYTTDTAACRQAFDAMANCVNGKSCSAIETSCESSFEAFVEACNGGTTPDEEHSCDKFAAAANRCGDPEDRLTASDIADCKGAYTGYTATCRQLFDEVASCMDGTSCSSIEASCTDEAEDFLTECADL